jgi:hypothetical protein
MIWCHPTALSQPSAQRDGGCVTPFDWEGRCDRGPESVSLEGETLLWIDEVAPLPWITKESDQRHPQHRVGWPALGGELFQPHPDINV